MGIYGYSINHNRANMITENKEEYDDLFSEAIIMSESIVYNEFLNHKSLLESFTGSNEERKVMEEKCDLLLEISMKDVKDKITKLIEQFINFIKRVISKIKEVSSKEKYKKAEKEIEELKKNITELNSEINLNKVKVRDISRELAEYKKQYEDLSDDYKKLDSNFEHIKRQKEKANEDFDKAIDNAIKYMDKNMKHNNSIDYMKDDPIFHFDLDDFIIDNNASIDVIYGNVFEFIEDRFDGKGWASFNKRKHYEEVLGNEKYQDNLHKVYEDIITRELERLRIIDPKFENKINKNDKGGRLQPGNLTKENIRVAVNEHLKNKCSRAVASLILLPIDEFIKSLEFQLKEIEKQERHCVTVIANYEKIMNKFNQKLNQVIEINKDKENIQKKITHLTLLTNRLIDTCKEQILFLYVMIEYSSKKCGYCYTMSKFLNKLIS